MAEKKKMRVLLIEDSSDEVKAFERHFLTAADAELIGVTASGYEGVNMTAELHPDAVILDLELGDGSGQQYLVDLNAKSLDRRPYILVTTRTTEDSTLRMVRRYGGVIQCKLNPDYKRNGPKVALDFLLRMRPFFPSDGTPPYAAGSGDDEQDRDGKLRKQISEVLGIIGITTGHNYHTYMVEAILLGTRCPFGSVDLENVIYPEMELIFKPQTRQNMERSMSRKLEWAWNHTDPAILEKYYTQAIDPNKGKPELAEFISYFATKFR